MVTLLKWLVSILLAGFAWLVTGYTMEYLRPYNSKQDRSGHGL